MPTGHGGLPQVPSDPSWSDTTTLSSQFRACHATTRGATISITYNSVAWAISLPSGGQLETFPHARYGCEALSTCCKWTLGHWFHSSEKSGSNINTKQLWKDGIDLFLALHCMNASLTAFQRHIRALIHQSTPEAFSAWSQNKGFMNANICDKRTRCVVEKLSRACASLSLSTSS